MTQAAELPFPNVRLVAPDPSIAIRAAAYHGYGPMLLALRLTSGIPARRFNELVEEAREMHRIGLPCCCGPCRSSKTSRFASLVGSVAAGGAK